MSAADYRDPDYRALCEELAKKHKLSPNNRRVRAGVDMYLAKKRQEEREAAARRQA